MTSDSGILTSDQLARLAPLGLALLLLLAAGLAADYFLLLKLRHSPRRWEECMARLRARPWSWREAIFLCVLALLLNQVAFVVVQAVRSVGGEGADVTAVTLLFQTAWIPLCLLAFLQRHLRRVGVTWREAFGGSGMSGWRKVRTSLLLLLAAWPPLALSAWTAGAIFTRLELPLESQFIVRLLTDPAQPVWLRVWLCVAAVTVAPVVEELAFRGILLPAFAKVSRGGLAVAAASALFATLHFNLLGFVPLFILAGSLSLAYVYTSSLLVPMVMHALFNATSLTILFFATRAG